MQINEVKSFLQVCEAQFNLSRAAELLGISQPALTRQIQNLEKSLGLEIFQRNGKRLIGLSEFGNIFSPQARALLEQEETLHRLAADWKNPKQGDLRIATTHTQARYVLPKILNAFRVRYPQISLHLQQGNPQQIAEALSRNEVDLGIATEGLTETESLLCLPLYRWRPCLITPPGHDLLYGDLTLDRLLDYPLITYLHGFTGRSAIDAAFSQSDKQPNVVLAAADADVIKTYVRSGLGVGIVASVACQGNEPGLDVRSVQDLFAANTAYLALRPRHFIREYEYEFFSLLAEHLQPELLQRAQRLYPQSVAIDLEMKP